MAFKSRNRWWTRERVLDAGARFYRKHKIAPTNDAWWHSLTRFTAATPDGASNQGRNRPYPSMGAINNYWKGLRDFWQDVAKAYPKLKLKLDRGDAPWLPIEEWFVVETAGVIPRTEVARLLSESGMGRTEPAIKRRLYELGVSCYNRWGWTINHLANVIGVSGAVIQKYIDHGKLPFFQGNRCLYIEPADFLVIQEYDWSRTDHPAELEQAIRKSLVQRMCYILLQFDFRKYSYHKIQPRRDVFTGRIKNARTISPPATPKPTRIAIGDWVEITGVWAKQPGAQGRIGQVKNLVWSPQRRSATQKSPARPACWVATVEFRKQKAHGNKYPRVRYNVPVAFLGVAKNPFAEIDAARKGQNKDKRDRSKRKAHLRAVGADLASNHLNIVKKPVDQVRDQRTRERGQKYLSNNLTVPMSEIPTPQSQRGRREEKWKVAING